VSTATPIWASDGNEPESSDTITREATADSNEIKSSPSQSRMALHNHTSIDDGVHKVLFSHRCREYQKLGLNLTQCVSDIWSTMSAYGGWARSIEVHASRSEVLDPVGKVFSLQFEPAIKGRVITG
jgi:hypothetical protein